MSVLGALQFSASQPSSQASRYHSNIMLNKQKGSSERGFYFHESPTADFCLHKMVRMEELVVLDQGPLNMAAVSVQASREDVALGWQQSGVALNRPRSTSFFPEKLWSLCLE